MLEEVLTISWPQEAERVPPGLLPRGARIKFDQTENVLSIPKTRLHARIISGSPKLKNAALQRCAIEASAPPLNMDIEEKVRWVFRKFDPEQPALEEVAHFLNMSQATLKRHLKRQGSSFIAVKNKVRFDRVTALLLSSNLSVEKIATRVGFSDASNLSKAFRQYFGRSPGSYRLQYSKKGGKSDA